MENASIPCVFGSRGLEPAVGGFDVAAAFEPGELAGSADPGRYHLRGRDRGALTPLLYLYSDVYLYRVYNLSLSLSIYQIYLYIYINICKVQSVRCSALCTARCMRVQLKACKPR